MFYNIPFNSLRPITLVVTKMLVRITCLDWLVISTSYLAPIMLISCVVIVTNNSQSVALNWITLLHNTVPYLTVLQAMLTLMIYVMLFLLVDNSYVTERQTYHFVVYHILLFTVAPLLCVIHTDQLQLAVEFLWNSTGHVSNALWLLMSQFIWPVITWVITLHLGVLLLSAYMFFAGLTNSLLSLYRKAFAVIRCLILIRLAFISSLVLMTLCPEQFMDHYSTMTLGMDITEGTQGLLSISLVDLAMKCLTPFIKVTLCEGEYIPFVPTYLLKSGTESLVRMYEHYPIGSPVKAFLADNCSHLLSPQVGPTTIPSEMASASNLLAKGAIPLPENHSTSIVKHLQRKAGVYVFIDNLNGTVSQCGSCIDFRDRLYSHYRQLNSVNIPFYKVVQDRGGFHHFHFSPIAVTPNYLYEYTALHQGTVSPLDTYVLKSFTQQEARTLEQAYSTFAQPDCYKGIPIAISHGKWVPGTFTELSGKLVEWTTLEGDIHKAMSIAEAADYLGVDPSTVRKKANCNMDAYVDSVTYGKVKVFIKGMPFVDKPSDRLPQFEDLNVDTSLLPVNKVFLFDQYLNQMELGPFDKVRDAVDAMSVKFQKKFFTMINKDALIYSHALGASYFLVSNQVSKLKASIVRNLTDGTSTEFGSMTSAINSLEPSIKVPAFVRKYVLKGEPYESKGKQYLVEFVNKGDHDDTVRRVKSERHTNYKNSLSKA